MFFFSGSVCYVWSADRKVPVSPSAGVRQLPDSRRSTRRRRFGHSIASCPAAFPLPACPSLLSPARQEMEIFPVSRRRTRCCHGHMKFSVFGPGSDPPDLLPGSWRLRVKGAVQHFATVRNSFPPTRTIRAGEKFAGRAGFARSPTPS